MSRKHCGVRFVYEWANVCFGANMLHHFQVVPYRCLLWASCNEKEAESLSHSTLCRRNLCRFLAGISRQVQGWIIDDHCISYPLRIFTIYIYIYVYIELVFFGVPILGLFRFTFCFLVTGTLNCPPPNPNARPQVISNAGSTAIYKLLARLCPCHESKICRIMPTSGPPSTSATADSLSRRLVWRRRAESDSHSDGAQKYMCSNRSNSTWWLIPLSKWVIFWYYSGYHLDE